MGYLASMDGLFLPTPSARRATIRKVALVHALRISTHALREEGDWAWTAPAGRCCLFLPTPSARRATENARLFHILSADFYPRPPRGGRLNGSALTWGNVQFLPTPSARRATSDDTAQLPYWLNFYPRPPRGGRPRCRRLPRPARNFYPRPPRGGRRLNGTFLNLFDAFLPTPSARRATRECRLQRGLEQHFYPRPPRGGRPCPSPSWSLPPDFYPRPPRGGRRRFCDPARRRSGISTHALREEGDPPWQKTACAVV